MDKLLRFLISRYVGLIVRRRKQLSLLSTQRDTPELLHAYSLFDQASQSGAGRQPYKGRDLWELLELHRPNSIVELGSGTTSAVFALWALRNEARYVCYEHHSAWAKVTEECLKESGLTKGSSPVKVAQMRVRDDGLATGFSDRLPADAEFVYVDGPPCRLDDGRKVPNDDVVRLFDVGVKPKVIVVDGRVDTVDLIRSHREMTSYSFSPSFVYCIRRKLWSAALAGREHSVFVRD